MSRAAVLDRLTDAILAVERPHPTRVPIDGHSAAGKTTLADELAPLIEARGRPCVRASIDDFHPPGHAGRSASGGYTAESYYDEAFQYERFRAFVLDPLGPGGDRRCRLAVWDSLHDREIPERWVDVPANGVLIADAAFAFRPELGASWDFVVWLDVDFDTALERARKRDVAWVGSEDVVVERYFSRNLPMHRRYAEVTRPAERANAVIDNRDVENPRIVRIGRRGTSDEGPATRD